MALTMTTTTTQELVLKPQLKTKLLRKLKAYAELRLQIKALEETLDGYKADIGTMREEAGVQTLSLEGFKVTQIAGVRKTLNHMKLVAMGVSLEMIDEATESKPNRPYEKISCPGDKAHKESD